MIMNELAATTSKGEQLANLVSDVFAVADITTGSRGHEWVQLRGRLRVPSAEAYDIVAPRFAALGYTALFRQAGEQQMIVAEPSPSQPRHYNPYVNILLFVLTMASMIFAGFAFVAPPASWTWSGVLPGLSFAFGLLIILVAHEMSHYFVARRFGVPISLPYFIPFPLSFFGTMGATEVMHGRPKNRRALLAVGMAGPLGGFVLALPILILGLSLSQVQPIPNEGYFIEGNSLLYLGVKYLMFGQMLPANGMDVFIHPIAFAGWGGLLVTALNLVPAGQLDGGHIIYALLGEKGRLLLWPILISLVILGIQWWPWWLWAGMIYFLGRVYAAPCDDITPLNTGERIAAIAMLVLFVLIFTPVPMRFG